MSKELLLWPNGSGRKAWAALSRSAEATVAETKLRELFPSAHPVLVSSGRAGLALSLAFMGLSRSQGVSLFPYASHCVLEAVSRHATPWHGNDGRVVARIIYHQWGYIQELGVSDTVIEDAVDCFCLPGATLMPAGGAFEVWSLPKILGTLSGGVIWCRQSESAEALRHLRDDRQAGALLQWGFRMLGRRWPLCGSLWAGRESLLGALPNWAVGEILLAIEHWSELAHARQERLDLVRSILPDWLPVALDRLPCVVPVGLDQARLLTNLGIGADCRTFERIDSTGQRTLLPCFPLPIHHEVPLPKLIKAVAILEAGR